MKRTAFLLLAALIAGGTCAAAADDERLSPFVAEYDVKYGNLSVGTSRTELSRDGARGRWVMETRLSASGLGRLIAGGNLVQRSSFETDGNGVRPLNYRFDDGMRRASRDVALDFDWPAGRVTGIAEGAPVDVPVEPGLQDAASNQAAVQAGLRNGAEPQMIAMIEKNRIKYYRYTLLRHERLETPLGALDTVVYRSSREGSTRETLFWYAPALGYATVRIEQRRDGKRLFQTHIREFRPGT